MCFASRESTLSPCEARAGGGSGSTSVELGRACPPRRGVLNPTPNLNFTTEAQRTQSGAAATDQQGGGLPRRARRARRELVLCLLNSYTLVAPILGSGEARRGSIPRS